MYGKTLAVIGLGRIGREVGIRMKSFGMKIIGYDPIPFAVTEAEKVGISCKSLDEIWPEADYITLHVPLIKETKNLVNEETLSKCKKGVRIVNVARGGIIDEDALLKQLQSGHVAAAVIDVYEQEPPVNRSLIEHDRVLCTPHLGASTKEAQVRVAQEVAEQIVSLKNGTPITGLYGAVNAKQLKAK